MNAQKDHLNQWKVGAEREVRNLTPFGDSAHGADMVLTWHVVPLKLTELLAQ